MTSNSHLYEVNLDTLLFQGGLRYFNYLFTAHNQPPVLGSGDKPLYALMVNCGTNLRSA